MVIKFDENIMLKKSLVSEKELSDTNCERLKKALIYIKNNLTDSDNNMYLTVDLLLDINNIITGLNNITLRQVNVKPYGCDKIYMDKDLIENKLYQLLDQFSVRKNNHRDFYFALLDNIHPFYDGNGELVRCYLLAISIRGYNFNSGSSIVNKGI